MFRSRMGSPIRRASSLKRNRRAAADQTSTLFDSRLSVSGTGLRDHHPRSFPRHLSLYPPLCVCSRRGRGRGPGRERDCEWRKSWEIWVSRSCYPIPGCTSLQWGFIYETRCHPFSHHFTPFPGQGYIPIDVCGWNRDPRLTCQSWMISSGCCVPRSAASQWNFVSI